jgi:Xaa-Pro dipeptidase
VKESGLYGAISIATGVTTLFIPKLPEEYKIWCGTIHPPEHFRHSYAVDDVKYTENLKAWIDDALAQGGQLHVMNGVNSDSGITAKAARYNGDEELWVSNKVNDAVLYELVAQARVTKSSEEVAVMRYVAFVASNAHVEVMRTIKSASFEYELEAKFLYEIYRNGGCRRCAYTSICACGPNSAVLHYGHAAAPNDRALSSTDIVRTVSFGFLVYLFFGFISLMYLWFSLGIIGYGRRVSRICV